MEKTKIEWADSTWNPVTGCYHNCEYCYARVTANRFKGCEQSPDGSSKDKIQIVESRLKATTKSGKIENAKYPYGFIPTLHKYRLNDLDTKKYGETIFVCSMADLFGDWVPDEWIEEVFSACARHPNHRYLFLTKNPVRYLELGQKDKLPQFDNFWYGTTVTNPKMPFFHSFKHNVFLSIEPILEPFKSDKNTAEIIENVDWVIFGAETGKRKNKVIPEKSWIESAVSEIRSQGKPVLMKDSLLSIWGEPLIREFPWK